MKQPSIRPVSSTEESARHGSGARAVITPNVKLPIEDGRDVYERSNLTRHQLLIWLGQKFEPDVPLYNVAVTFTLSGGLDPGHFRKAFQTLIDSSDALRTVIEEMDGVPQQRVLESLRYEAAYLDFSASSEPEAAFQNWLQDRARVLFDFRRRLFDSALAKIGADRFVWFLNQHHIITDGWSVALAYQYMSELYERSLHGRLDEAAPLPRFEDYIRREREDRTSARHSEAAAYWKRKLADKPEPLVYSGSYQKRTHNVQRVSCNLGVERTQRIKALAARKDVFSATEQASIFNIFAALLFIYLYRVTGNRRQSIGAPFLNRRSNAFRETLGLFMEVLPLHVALEEGDTPLSVIRKVRGEMSEIGRFSGFTLANSPGDKSYDVLLNYHIAPFAKFHGLSMEQKWIYTGRENDALALQVYEVEDAGTFALHFDFHSDVFNAEQRRQAVRHFLQLFDAFAEDPAGSLYSVSLLDPEERQRLLVEWNSTKRDYPRDKCVHELFEAQVERTPDAVALVFPSTGSGHGEDGQITYRELNRRANQLAHYLKRRGLGPEVLAGIYMERSLEMALALLGILKAGAAYVPIDASYPQPRVEFMLRDSAMAVLLTQRRLAERLPQDGVHTICLDADCPDIARESDANPVSGARPENLAYVIYTSGSTGTPKGVLIEHRQILNYVQAIWERYGLKTGATFAMLQPLSVDSSQTVI
ncbi:MAG TPA: condensation domain-containing protein, partial [Candidatus Binatia bacterium]